MSESPFAQVPLEAIQQLSGLRYQFFTIVLLEEFLGGGVCKLTPLELSDKYVALKNETNVYRLRKEMIGYGLFVNVIVEIVTKKFNNTAKIAVTEEPETEAPKSDLQNLQPESESTAKIAVINNNDKQNAAKIAETPENELQKLQQSTAKIAGMEVANKDLEFKEIINKNSLSPRAREPDDFPDAEILESGKRGIPIAALIPENTETDEYQFNQTLVEALKIRLKSPVKLPDEYRWSQAIGWAWQNQFPAEQCIEVFDLCETIRKLNKGRWSISPELWQRNIPKIESLREEIEELKTGAKKSGNPKQPKYPGKTNGTGAVHSSTDFDDARFAGKTKPGI